MTVGHCLHLRARLRQRPGWPLGTRLPEHGQGYGRRCVLGCKAGHANLQWQDNAYTQTATSDSGELLYTIVPTAVRQDSDLEP